MQCISLKLLLYSFIPLPMVIMLHTQYVQSKNSTLPFRSHYPCQLVIIPFLRPVEINTIPLRRIGKKMLSDSPILGKLPPTPNILIEFSILSIGHFPRFLEKIIKMCCFSLNLLLFGVNITNHLMFLIPKRRGSLEPFPRRPISLSALFYIILLPLFWFSPR